MIGCTRDLIEWTVRGCAASLPNVRFLERIDVTRLLPGRGKKVAGVKLRPRDRTGSGSEEPLHANLVVDASGRNSNAPRWPRVLGYETPEEAR